MRNQWIVHRWLQSSQSISIYLNGYFTQGWYRVYISEHSGWKRNWQKGLGGGFGVWHHFKRPGPPSPPANISSYNLHWSQESSILDQNGQKFADWQHKMFTVYPCPFCCVWDEPKLVMGVSLQSHQHAKLPTLILKVYNKSQKWHISCIPIILSERYSSACHPV